MMANCASGGQGSGMVITVTGTNYCKVGEPLVGRNDIW